jgi:hypothetical protein
MSVPPWSACQLLLARPEDTFTTSYASTCLLFRGVPSASLDHRRNDPTGAFQRADDVERSRLTAALSGEGLAFVRRYSGGPDIDAACGMLASVRRGGQAIA